MPLSPARQPLSDNESGVAAVEFALLLPLLITMFFGAVEVANLLIADNKLRAATAGVADLITQDSDGSITLNELTQATTAAAEIMRPMPANAGNMAILVTDFRVASDGTINVVWTRMLAPGNAPAQNPTTGLAGMQPPTCTNNTGNDGTSTTVSLPVDLSVDSNGDPVSNDVIRVDAIYKWTPWFSMIFNADIFLHSTNYFMPRYSISLSAAADVTPPCTP